MKSITQPVAYFLVYRIMKSIFLFFFLSSAFICAGQQIESFESFDDFEAKLSESNKTLVVNYWATWCAPCIKELVYFEELEEKYKDQDVEVILVSLDFKNQYDRRLIPFVEKRGLKSRVIHLADPKTNDWIDKVDPSWSGSIPATQIIRGNKKIFMERSFDDLASLEEVLHPFLDN